MQKKTTIVIGVLIFFCIVIFFARSTPPILFTSGVFQNLFSIPKSFIYDFRGNGSQESGQIKKLIEENKNLSKKLLEFERIKKDNDAFRSQFETEQAKQYKLLPAKVIGFGGSFSNPTTLVIDKGTSDGVKKDMAVISDNNLVGKIGEVSQNYSQLILPVSKKFMTLGKTSEGQLLGVVSGTGDFIFFDRVETTKTLTNGETVLTKGEVNSSGAGVPPDFVIGKISSVNKNESLPFQNAKIESIIQFSRLYTVFVVLGL